MKRYLFLALFSCFYGLSVAQDQVITWNGDTLACRMPESPWKEGLRPSYKYENGYLRTVTVFATDSIRVIEAGEVKGYYRQKHGKRYLCDGYFEARKVSGPDLIILNAYRNDPDNPWYFMDPLVKGKHASLYRIYVRTNRTIRPVYLISQPGDDDPLHTKPVWTRKDIYKLLGDGGLNDELRKIRKTKRQHRFVDIVHLYNKRKG